MQSQANENRDPGPAGDAAGAADALPTAARIALLGVAAFAILTWLFLAFAHLGDRYNVNAVSGTLLAFADRARDGVLYPPFFDGQSYGGTRMMPLPILLYSTAITLGGDLLAPAKLVDLSASAVLVLLLVGVLRRQGASLALSLGLASTVVTSQVFLLAGTGIRPESLPTALQLGAVALVAHVPRRSATVVAAVICAVAVLTKASAIWAPATIVVWLLFSNRGGLLLFAATLAGSLLALLAAFNLATDGRMLANLLGLGGAGLSVTGVARSPLKSVELLAQYAQATLVLLPALVVAALSVTRSTRPTLFQVALCAATGVLLIAMADAGSDYNHLLDVVVLVPIVAFQVVRKLGQRTADVRIAWSFLAAAILVGSTSALAVNAASSVAATLGLPGASEPAGIDPHPLEAELDGLQSVLAEDPYLNLSRGERPVVLDPFMFVRIAQREPDLVEPLLVRIRSQGFDAIVLSRDLEDPAAVGWFSDFAFGLPFYEAVRANYSLCSVSGGAFLYVASSRACPG